MRGTWLKVALHKRQLLAHCCTGRASSAYTLSAEKTVFARPLTSYKLRLAEHTMTVRTPGKNAGGMASTRR